MVTYKVQNGAQRRSDMGISGISHPAMGAWGWSFVLEFSRLRSPCQTSSKNEGLSSMRGWALGWSFIVQLSMSDLLRMRDSLQCVGGDWGGASLFSSPCQTSSENEGHSSIWCGWGLGWSFIVLGFSSPCLTISQNEGCDIITGCGQGRIHFYPVY